MRGVNIWPDETNMTWMTGRSTENTLANVNIQQLANILLAPPTRFNEALMLWCAFAWCAMKCRLYCLYRVCLQFAVKKAVVEEEELLKTVVTSK